MSDLCWGKTKRNMTGGFVREMREDIQNQELSKLNYPVSSLLGDSWGFVYRNVAVVVCDKIKDARRVRRENGPGERRIRWDA